ncbi:MAG: hypothetical protein IT581_14820 [Verrucomicrobiales bacterium]|nr:hypothetical protein [Verrucomicrobiales bacterium]
MKSSHMCPVCGFPGLKEPPRSRDGGGSYEICPSCGFQFGVDDDDRRISVEQWRSQWIRTGKRWSSRGLAAPEGWDPDRQLESLRHPKSPPRSPKP